MSENLDQTVHSKAVVRLAQSPSRNVNGGRAYEMAGAYPFDSIEEPEGGGLFEYWRILRRHRRTVIVFAIAGALLGILIGIPQTAVYRARTSLEILSLNEDFLNMKQSSPVTSTDASFETSELQTQAQILQSESLLARVFKDLDDRKGTAVASATKEAPWWRRLTGGSEQVEMTPRERAVNKIINSLKVRPAARTRIIEITADSTNAKLATDFLNTLSNEFIQQNIEARWKTTERTSDWLSRELNDTRNRLAQSEDALQRYARSSGLIFTDQDTSVATEKLQQVQQELSTATADRIAKQARYELAQSAMPDSLPDVLNDPALRESQAKLTDLRRQIAELSATYTPEYSKVKRLQAQVTTLQAAFDHDRADIINRIHNDFQEASRREKLLTTTYNAQTREVTGEGEKSIQYNILRREVESNRQLYDNMLQQMKQSSIASAMRASNVRVVDPAEIPKKPFWPNFLLLGPAGLLSGLLAGITVVFLRERADRTLQQPGDMQLWTNLPELGTIPNAFVVDQNVSPEKRSGAVIRAQLIEDELGSRNEPLRNTVGLITWERKPSLVAEAFRTVLTSILFVGENGSRPRVLVFTSASASDGKTTVVSNLAIAMAEIRRKVLIVDADLRRPRMHQVFEVDNARGLSDLLKEEVLSYEAVSNLVQTTRIPGLHILPSGPSTHAAANLLYSPHLTALLAKFKQEYDMVLIDTPPMLTMTDARVIGRSADAVVLVARAEQTTRDAIMAVNNRFSEDRIRVLGTILNGWDPKRSANGYYGYGNNAYYSEYRRYSQAGA